VLAQDFDLLKVLTSKKEWLVFRKYPKKNFDRNSDIPTEVEPSPRYEPETVFTTPHFLLNL
jgi:hypothetical protein